MTVTERATTVDALLAPGAIRSLVQPIVRTSDLEVVGYEALARMHLEPARPPDWWLDQATRAGIRHAAEVACIEAAARLGPPPDGRFLFVNASPSILADPTLLRLRDRLPGRLVIELSETEPVSDYEALRRDLRPWLEAGVRTAIDDTGAGYSSLRHVVELAPDFLKLDRELVRGLHEDPGRLALVRAIVAFAHEVGTSVVGEGVETPEELDALREAGVHFVQGYLLARPGEPWAEVVRPGVGGGAGTDAECLARTLDGCEDVRQACEAAVEHIFRQGDLMPSVYVARGSVLRCVAQRGLWQVLDGMPVTTGVTGRTFATGEPAVVTDVAAEPGYLEAIPGVATEVCLPLMSRDRTVGALNIESFGPIASERLDQLHGYAAVLGSRLDALGYRSGDSAWHRAGAASLTLSALRRGPGLSRQALHCVLEASGFDSGAIVLGAEETQQHVVASAGPLAAALACLDPDDLGRLCRLVGDVRSCYSAGDPSAPCFVGTESLRDAGARAMVVLPLWSRKRRLGTVLLAHARPVRVDGDRVEPLELLADRVASVLSP